MPDPSDPATRATNLFLVYLRELPLDGWVQAVKQRPRVPNMSKAEGALRLVVRQLDHRGDIFATKDAVLDALQRFECADGRRLTRVRSANEHLRPATENAALAILLRQRLSAEDFSTLYAPFETLIPSAILFGLRE